MDGKAIIALGYPEGRVVGFAIKAAKRARKEMDADALAARLKEVLDDPAAFTGDPTFGPVAEALLDRPPVFVPRDGEAPYRVWGTDLESGALNQMKAAVRLPVAVRGALMPDAHQGYGLPIGGVLATQNAVIPYAVGVDIACRMRLTLTDIPAADLPRHADELRRALERETFFGAGSVRRKRADHDVLEADWNVAPVVSHVKEKAADQLGTSGSGNHFVEFGEFTLHEPDLGLPAGKYVALLSHSGSRGPGAMIAAHYSALAKKLHPELPGDLIQLAWLDMDSDPGREYWAAMELMGRFAAANHEIIHQAVVKAAGTQALASVENHHNFAWKETHDGQELIVHRKGATPAGKGVLGVIPGSMATPGFLVRGQGNEESLRSASHGAGRRMSRTAAKQKYRWNHLKDTLSRANVTVLSAGIDENPHAYKDIHEVMAAQKDLVRIIGQFDPRIVRMAPDDEPPED